MASQQLPPEPCHSCSRGGKGACVRSSSINMVRELLQSHLDSLLMTRINAAFSSLSRWLSARRSDRAFSSSSSSAAFRSRALRSNLSSSRRAGLSAKRSCRCVARSSSTLSCARRSVVSVKASRSRSFSLRSSVYNWENRGYRQTQKGPDVGHELKPEQGRVGHGGEMLHLPEASIRLFVLLLGF